MHIQCQNSLKVTKIVFLLCIKHALISTATLAKISLYKKRRSNTVNKKTSCEQQVSKKKRGFLVNMRGTVPFLKQALQHWGFACAAQ